MELPLQMQWCSTAQKGRSRKVIVTSDGLPSLRRQKIICSVHSCNMHVDEAESTGQKV